MSDRVCAQLGVVHYMCSRSWYHNTETGMVLGVSGCILDIRFEMLLEVIQQTHNRILQMSPFFVACHVILLLPQLLVPSRVDFFLLNKFCHLCTVIILTLCTIQFNFNDSVLGIYHKSNST